MWPIIIVIALAIVLYLLRRDPHPRAMPVKPAKRTNDDAPLLPGNDEYEMEIVGESHYQTHLRRVCGGCDEDGVDLETDAVIVFDNGNPHDAQAVKVMIDGGTVGHLSREAARTFRKKIAQSQFKQHDQFRCKALIRGGWDRGGGDTGMFGVRLDVDLRAR